MKELGFGCLRLPLACETDGLVDQKQFNRMVDVFLSAGFSYFDTARPYLNGQGEAVVREGLVKRYPRGSFQLADKLTWPLFRSESDILPLFQQQLESCGVEHFDCYLLHGLNERTYERFVECHAFELVSRFKEEGKVRRIGVSFHDKPAVLERILKERPEIEVVQIQLNYADYDDPVVEGGAVYEVCRRYAKPVIVMEPVKGGILADNLPEEALGLLAGLGGGSPASYAIRYAASFENVSMVLSGMGTIGQVEENIHCMRHFQPLTEEERSIVHQVGELLKRENLIPCTACRYCVAGCPQRILIPKLFACMNTKRKFKGLDNGGSYAHYTARYGKASDCIGCRQCERACPQHLPIVELLKEVAWAYEQAVEQA